MNVYFDTSALVPLLVSESTSAACRELWESADRILATRLAYVESAAALAQAARLRRISGRQHRQTLALLDQLWSSVDVIELDEALMSQAAALCMKHVLRGSDATHCAAALAVSDDQLVGASGDARLLAAWRSEGLAVSDVTV